MIATDIPISETQLQQAVIDTARWFGWRVAHFRPAQTKHGWRTPVTADGKGFPDLVLAHPGQRRLIFAELKSKRGRLSDDQTEWLTILGQVADSTTHVDVHIWTPDDWPETILTALTGLPAVLKETA